MAPNRAAQLPARPACVSLRLRGVAPASLTPESEPEIAPAPTPTPMGNTPTAPGVQPRSRQPRSPPCPQSPQGPARSAVPQRRRALPRVRARESLSKRRRVCLTEKATAFTVPVSTRTRSAMAASPITPDTAKKPKLASPGISDDIAAGRPRRAAAAMLAVYDTRKCRDFRRHVP